jgi:ABC-2 type transport system ATP-binding protein
LVDGMKSAISIKGLFKRYGDLDVLKGVDLEIGRGEFYALMGQNGSGKTTLISIVTGTSPPTRGRVEIHGHDVVDEPEKVKTIIGYVPQENFSSPTLTGHENLVYFARLFGLTKAEANRVARELLERMGLAGDARKRVSDYSGGMRKRLEVATALLPGIEVLFLDEPTTGLDPSARKEFLGTLREVNEEGATVFMVTHIGEDAEVTSRVGFMDDGRIVLEGEPDRLKEGSGLQNVIEVETPFKGKEVASAIRAFSVDGRLQETGEGYRLYCEEPEEAMPRLVRALDGVGCGAERIEARAPSLEDVFFKATRKPLRG